MLLKSNLEKLEAIRLYIINNLDTDLSIKGLSCMFDLSSSTLRRQFHIHFQTTVYKYISQQRMEYAKELIIACDNRINEISEKVGYAESSNFSHAFMKYFGLAPSKFYNQYQGVITIEANACEHN